MTLGRVQTEKALFVSLLFTALAVCLASTLNAQYSSNNPSSSNNQYSSNNPSAGTLAPRQSPTAANANATSSSPETPKTWLVRDPATGRVFQQQLISVNIPVTRWEAKTVEQTVYEPIYATQLTQVPQATCAPDTQFVLQSKLRGWSNPHKPLSPHSVKTQQWVAKQQQVLVYQPVQTTDTRQQLVQTELPQPPSATIVAKPTTRQPLFRLPILAQQRILPWPAAQEPASNQGLRPISSTQSVSMPQLPGILSFGAQTYPAPLQTNPNATAARDNLQSGMQPTVLR